MQTLDKAIEAMRNKIEEQIEVFKSAPLSQSVATVSGESMQRQNPDVSEFRALVKDYGQAIRTYNELSKDDRKDEGINNLDAIRSKFKVV